MGVEHCSAVQRFENPDELEKALTGVEREGYLIKFIECGTNSTFLSDLADALLWEEQFGYRPERLNLDALNDALRGVPNETEPKVALVFRNFLSHLRRSGTEALRMLSVIEDQSRDHAAFNERLIAFLEMADPDAVREGPGA